MFTNSTVIKLILTCPIHTLKLTLKLLALCICTFLRTHTGPSYLSIPHRDLVGRARSGYEIQPLYTVAN